MVQVPQELLIISDRRQFGDNATLEFERVPQARGVTMLPTARSVIGAGVLAIGCPLGIGASSVQVQAPSAQAQAPRLRQRVSDEYRHRRPPRLALGAGGNAEGPLPLPGAGGFDLQPSRGAS